MRATAPGLESGSLSNFAGGPNFRDAPSELAPAETYGSWNITYDERGGAASRLGYVKRNSSRLGGVNDYVVNDFYSQILGAFLTQSGKKLYKADNTTAVQTFTTNDCVTYTEMNGKVIVGHPADGLYYSTDGSSWTHITAANAPATAACVCVWQAKLFVGLADGSVHWSAIGDPLTWDIDDFNEIWTKDQQPIVAMCVGSGQDIQGRPGLLVFKQESVYRINSAATGAYTVLSTSEGAASAKAVVGVGSRVCWIGTRGVFWWREDQAGPVSAADQLQPLWQSSQLSFANQAGWCAGRRMNRALFSCSTVNSSVNDIAFEYHPDEHWIAPRSDAVTCYATSSDLNETTCGGSATAAGQTYKLASGGADDGTAISWWIQTRWLAPNGGFQAFLWQLRVHGRGTGTVTVRKDYESAGGTSYAFNLDLAATDYDTGLLYDSGVTYGIAVYQATEAFYDLGALRQFSLLFAGSSSTTVSGRSLFGNAPAPVVGAFGLYQLEYLHVPLGLS